MTSSPDNPIMKDLLNEDKLKKAMAQSIQDQKKLSPDNTVEKIVDDIIHIGYVNGYNQLAQMAQVAPYNYIEPISEEQAKQSLDSHYLSIFLELVGEDEDSIYEGNIKYAHRDKLRAELRTALQDRLGGK